TLATAAGLGPVRVGQGLPCRLQLLGRASPALHGLSMRGRNGVVRPIRRRDNAFLWRTTESDDNVVGRPTMTEGRRALRYGSFDEIMPDVERLLEGNTTLGHWSLAQICRHLASTLRRVVDLPASTPSDPSRCVPEDEKRKVLETGVLPEGLPGPAE